MDFKKEKLLVIAPHADDEVLGCGGLIKKIKNAGGRVYVQFLTNAPTRDFSKKGSSTLDERQKEIEAVANYLSFDDWHMAFEDEDHHLKLDKHGQAKIITLVERQSPLAIEKIKPTIIALPSLYAYNQDHQLTARAVHAALRPAEETKHFVPTVLAYEMPADKWSVSTQNVPNYLVRLKVSEFRAKLHSIKLYASQLRPSPNPRALKTVEALGRLRGALCGARFAEAYHLYRQVV